MNELQILIDRYLAAQDKALDEIAEQQMEEGSSYRAEQDRLAAEAEAEMEDRYWDDVAEEEMDRQSRRECGHNAQANEVNQEAQAGS